MTTTTQRVIPALIYDTLHLSALAFGGIGSGSYGKYDEEDEGAYGPSCPNCVHGHAMSQFPDYDMRNEGAGCDTRSPYTPTIGTITENDAAVMTINSRKGTHPVAKVTWEEYVAERGWVRGEDEA